MAPAQQRLAAGHLVVVEIDQRLVVDLEVAVHQRLAQIPLQGEPCLGAGIHRRLEEAVGAAAVRLGAVHRQIRVLDQLVEVGAVLRRHGDADAGIGGEVMAEAFIGLPDRLLNAGHEFHDVVGVGDVGLDDRELVAAEPRDEVGIPDAAFDPRRPPPSSSSSPT